ncbi:hypothetical protein IscW_ISCW011703 [Ixodes scapularis]|uniref:Uncharacterized protein n=1 Tax=Ixodes scapularis TaxID=6945 RepID=B7Q4Z1_IXOSC|nr:hypothetical protein IscW_ISCW011703 [Ixodes scapularis]|eukprot:XP_002411649.1 hypothetical protein IscW_ISCW011703 [Ixodes scapularis]
MTEAAGGGSSSSSAPRRTPVIRLHGAPTLSPRQAPKKGGRRASEFYFREPEYLAPPRPTVSTPPPGRKRSASLPHVRSPSPVPPPLARAARAHHEVVALPAKVCPSQERRPSLDLSAGHGMGHITLGSHLDSEIARRRHSVAASAAYTSDKTATTTHDNSQRLGASDRVSAQPGPGHESWLEEASSSDDDFAVDTKPTMTKSNASTGLSKATGNGSRGPVS